jgi:glycosyltransferase involved in cell wall biosynthesis
VRLLLVSHLPLHHQNGGTVRWRYLAEALPALGWDVRVVSGAGDVREHGNVAVERTAPRLRRAARGGARLALRGGRAAGVDPAAFFPDPLWALRGRAAIAAAVDDWRPDVIYATMPPPSAMFAASAVAARTGIPLVLEFRDVWGGNPGNDVGRPWLAHLQRGPMARAARVVCMTPDACARLAQLHPELADRLTLLPNGYDPRLLAARAQRTAPPAGPAMLIHAGALYGPRSIDGLLGALARPELRGRARLVLLGGLNDRSAAAIAALDGAVDVEVCPPTTWERAVAATAQASVAVVLFTPGDATAVPGKLFEALALGVPVLALVSDDSAMERLLRRERIDAEIAAHDDCEAIAAALARLLDDPPPPAPLEQIAAYDRSRIAAELAAMLDAVSSRGRTRRAGGRAPSPAALA